MLLQLSGLWKHRLDFLNMINQTKIQNSKAEWQSRKRRRKDIMQCSCWRDNVQKSVFSELGIPRSIKQSFFAEEFGKEFQHEFCTKVNSQLQKALYVLCLVEHTDKTSFLTIFFFTTNCCSESHQTQSFFLMLSNWLPSQQQALLLTSGNQCHAWWHEPEDLQRNQRALTTTYFTQLWC